MRRDVDALLAYLAERGPMPHEWGRRKNDCIAFLAGAVKAQTGRTRLGRLTWSNRSGALKLLARLGGIEAVLDARFERIAPAHAMRGDIAGVPAILTMEGVQGSAFAMRAAEVALMGFHPMLVEGDMLCAPGPDGLSRVPRALMAVAWSAVSHV